MLPDVIFEWNPSYLQGESIRAGMCYFNNLWVAFIQDTNAIYSQDNIPDFQTGTFRWSVRFDRRYHNRFRSMNPETELPRLTAKDHGFVAFCKDQTWKKLL